MATFIEGQNGLSTGGSIVFISGGGGGGGGGGAQGAQGAQGPQGSQGHQGFQGIAGAQGSSGTGAQGATGSLGPQGVQGTQGPQGFQGGNGLQGSQGSQGAQGSQGLVNGVLAINQGGTGAQSAAGAVTNLLGTAQDGSPDYTLYVLASQITGTEWLPSDQLGCVSTQGGSVIQLSGNATTIGLQIKGNGDFSPFQDDQTVPLMLCGDFTDTHFFTIDGTCNVAATSYTGIGSGLTALNATNISTGTVATARLASGTASSSTYLRGDQTWAAIAAGPQGYQGGLGSQGPQGYQGASGSGGGGTPGGSNTQIQYNNSGAFAGTSNITTDGTSIVLSGGGNLYLQNGSAQNDLNVNSMITNSPTLLLEQTGGAYGSSSLTLTNTAGAGGAVFYGGANYLIDLAFTTNANIAQCNIRLEQRGDFNLGSGNGTYGEFQYNMNATGASYYIPYVMGYKTIVMFPQPSGSGGTFSDGRIGIGVNSPSSKFHVLGSTTIPAMILQSPSGGTLDLQQNQNSSGTTISGINSGGVPYTGSSTTSGRPTVTAVGSIWFDTTLGYLIAWNGSHWVNGSGTTV